MEPILQVGMVWVGKKTWDTKSPLFSPGDVQGIELGITWVEGTKFGGYFKVVNSKNWPIQVSGNILDDGIEWTAVEARGDTYKVKIDGNRLTGRGGTGTIDLTLEERRR